VENCAGELTKDTSVVPPSNRFIGPFPVNTTLQDVDLNTLLNYGTYDIVINPSALSVCNLPPDAVAVGHIVWATLSVFGTANTRLTQLLSLPFSHNRKTYIRYKHDSNWSPWYEFSIERGTPEEIKALCSGGAANKSPAYVIGFNTDYLSSGYTSMANLRTAMGIPGGMGWARVSATSTNGHAKITCSGAKAGGAVFAQRADVDDSGYGGYVAWVAAAQSKTAGYVNIGWNTSSTVSYPVNVWWSK